MLKAVEPFLLQRGPKDSHGIAVVGLLVVGDDAGIEQPRAFAAFGEGQGQDRFCARVFEFFGDRGQPSTGPTLRGPYSTRLTTTMHGLSSSLTNLCIWNSPIQITHPRFVS